MLLFIISLSLSPSPLSLTHTQTHKTKHLKWSFFYKHENIIVIYNVEELILSAQEK